MSVKTIGAASQPWMAVSTSKTSVSSDLLNKAQCSLKELVTTDNLAFRNIKYTHVLAQIRELFQSVGLILQLTYLGSKTGGIWSLTAALSLALFWSFSSSD